MEEETMDPKLEENLPLPDESHEENADKSRIIECGKYVVHISKQANGEFKAQYFQVNRDHTYCLPSESSTNFVRAKKRLENAVNKAKRKSRKRKKSLQKVPRKEPQKPKPKKDVPVASWRVYELTCGECDNKSWHDFKEDHHHLQDYMSEGVTICCMACGTKSRASLELADQRPKGVSEKQPMFKCDNSECLDRDDQVFTNFIGLGMHREKVHSVSLQRKETVDIEREALVDEPIQKKTKKKKWHENSTASCSDVSYQYKCTIGSCVREFITLKHYEKHGKSHEPGAKFPCACNGCRFKPQKRKMLPAELSCGVCDHAHFIRILEKSIFLTNGVGFICLNCKCNNKPVIPTIMECRKPPSQDLVFTCGITKCEGQAGSLLKLKRHMACHEYDPVTCDKCGMIYKNKKQLRGHQNRRCRGINKERQTCVCHLCHNKFTDKYKLQQHLRRIHSKRKPTCLCEECGLDCNYQWKLRKHKEKVHENPGQKNFQRKPINYPIYDPDLVCPVCSKGFKVKKSFKGHIRKAHGAKRFHCDLCEKFFQSASDMRRHRERHFNQNAKLFLDNN